MGPVEKDTLSCCEIWDRIVCLPMTDERQLTLIRIAIPLRTWAHQTAADMGEDYAAGVRAIRDEPVDVAVTLGCSVEDVIEWCESEMRAAES